MRTTHFKVIIFLIALSSSAAVGHNCRFLFDPSVKSQFEILQSLDNQSLQVLKINKSLSKNNFTTSRNLTDYDSVFKLRPLLAKMTAKQRWLDSGAGRAIAQLEYLSLFKKYEFSSPQLVALAYKKPWFVTSKKINFKYLSGRKLEDYTTTELGKFDLITDFFGPFSYTENAIQVLNVYLDILNVGGTLKIYFTSPHNVVYNKNNEIVSLETWLIQNLNKNSISDAFEVTFEKGTLTVIRKKEQVFKLPALELNYFYADLPPIRKYKENNTSD
jgi:SAM-dependent methyltransferase